MRFIIIFLATVLALAGITVVINLRSWQESPLQAEEASISDGASIASAHATGSQYAMAVVNVRNLGQAEPDLRPGANGKALADLPNPEDAKARASDSSAFTAQQADVRAPERPTDKLEPAATSEVEPTVQPTSSLSPSIGRAIASLGQPALTIGSALVNVRAGPATAYPVLLQATNGQQFSITARNHDHTWWQVCCVQEQSGWIFAELVQAAGSLDGVRMAENIPPPPSPTPTSAAALVMAAEVQGPTSPQATEPCPAQSSRQYTAINMAGIDASRADHAHGDLNLALRGSTPTGVALALVDISGAADPHAPKLSGLFADGRVPTFTSTHQVYDWNWGCGSDGCRGDLLSQRESTLVGMATAPGEEIRIPTRQQQIFGGGYMAAVLYAEPTRLTLNYTREGSAGAGYTVHLENLCVDPNLLALYRSSNAGGRGQLPALHNGDVVGAAAGGEIRISIRDSGTFMDPRSRKDWW